MSIGVSKTKKFAVFDLIGSSVSSASQYSQNESSLKSATADDHCQSLFYGPVAGSNGSGFPTVCDIPEAIITQLKTVHPEYMKLPFDFYKRAVECLPIICVDVVCRRKSDNKILLFYRRDKPAANIWWWPGGRMFKGETFFETACRKIRDETGHTDAAVQPVAVLNVWNTFFPDSNWDAERAPGREGTQTVNICVLCVLEDSEGGGGGEAGGPADLDIKSAASAAWAVEARRWVTVDEVLLTNDYDKYVSLNVRRAVELGYM